MAISNAKKYNSADALDRVKIRRLGLLASMRRTSAIKAFFFDLPSLHHDPGAPCLSSEAAGDHHSSLVAKELQ